MKRVPLTLAASLLALSVAWPAVAQKADLKAEPKADQKLIQAHMNFLADDLLEGRETGSRGYDIAAQYVASQFIQYGVAPKGDKGYIQPVTLRSARLDLESPVMEVITKAGREKLAFMQDFSFQPALLEATSEVTAPLVFVGYGIQAERFQIDDYAGIDAKGKIVVLMTGRPASLPTEEGAHFGSNDHKRAVAARHGAVGTIVLQTPKAEKNFPFTAAKQYLYLPRMTWLNKEGKAPHEYPTLQNGAFMSLDGAKKLFSQVDVKLDDIYAAAEAGKPVPRMDLNLSAHMAKKTTLTEVQSSNVVGMVEGSDARLKNEYVVYTAHLDHLGVVKERMGDNIFNGAMDNASGVATLIEMARLVSAMPVKPKRSILFVALTGEEKGLLGGDYFAQHPTVPLQDLVANVNLDMPLLTYDFANVVAFGAQHSSLEGSIKRAARRTGLDLIPDPWPEQGLFTRSDHYMFVRQGVPSVFLMTGMASFKKDEDPGKLWGEFLAKHYHKPNDDMNQPMNWEAAARFAQVNFHIGVEVANEKDRPTWNKGNFFGDLFGKKK